MDVKDESVAEAQEQLLSVGPRLGEDAAVEARRAFGEAALRAADRQAFAAEDVLELPRQAVDGMAFRHCSAPRSGDDFARVFVHRDLVDAADMALVVAERFR
jgi:hypothetical protein